MSQFMKQMKSKKRGFSPFRIAAVCLFVLVGFLGIQIPNMAAKADRVKQELYDRSESYFNAQAKYNRLNTEVNEINTTDFVERTARRELGYVWYGETIYTVKNLAELEEKVTYDEIYQAVQVDNGNVPSDEETENNTEVF
ncbi:MAG: septum formation initiator family protein [Clostridia bacterium]|nr:septum formation initiator family protein [Clostridia bacterium]